jgi:hypothetical protein
VKLSFGGITLYGNVTCLRVVNAMASIAGEVTRIEPPTGTFSMIRSFGLQVSDGGKFGSDPDTFASGFSISPAPPDSGCLVPTPGSPISSGEIVIHDELI